MADINYLDGIPLGKIERFTITKESNFDIITMPGVDSAGTEVVDTLGVAKIIRLTSKIIGDFSDINTYIYLLDSKIDGFQTSISKLYSPYIVAKNFEKERRQGGMGITTSTASFRLKDSSATFQTWGVQPYDYVKNLVTGSVTTVLSVVSETELEVFLDYFPSGVPYAFTTHLKCKLLRFQPTWEPPGINKCIFDLELVHSR